jgi:hypothetical protein
VDGIPGLGATRLSANSQALPATCNPPYGQPKGCGFESYLGTQRGQVLAVHADHSENIGRCRVRSQCQLARKSSKRVQTGEPLCIVFIPLSAEPAERG